MLLFPVWTILLAGFISPQLKSNDFNGTQWQLIQFHFTDSAFWWTFLSITMLLASVFIINQFTDIQSDKKNNKLFLLADGLISKKIAISEIAVCITLAFLFAMLRDIHLVILCFTLFLVTGIGYSLPPFLWKDKPIAGLLVNMMGGLLTFLIGWQIITQINLKTVLFAVPYLFAIGAVYLLTTIPDKKGDEFVGKITFAVKFDLRVTIWTAILFEIICLLTAILLKDYVMLFPAIAVMPFFIKFLFKYNLNNIILTTRFSILFLSITVVLIFPAYAVLMLAIFFLSKWYYRNRFQLNYPNFSHISEQLND